MKNPAPAATGNRASQLIQSTTIDEAQDTKNLTKFNIVERSGKPRFLGDILAPIVTRISRRHAISEQYARVVCQNLHIGEDAA